MVAPESASSDEILRQSKVYSERILRMTNQVYPQGNEEIARYSEQLTYWVVTHLSAKGHIDDLRQVVPLTFKTFEALTYVITSDRRPEETTDDRLPNHLLNVYYFDTPVSGLYLEEQVSVLLEQPRQYALVGKNQMLQPPHMF